MLKQSTIDILIPVYNEESYIENCLKTVCDFEVPKNIEINIFLIDGGSNDMTINIIEKFISKKQNFFLLKNIHKTQAHAMNIGIRNSHGEFVMRLDAHSLYPKDYLKLCYETMQNVKADNIGGMIQTLPGADTYGAQVVQALTTHPFGVGDSGFRTNLSSGYVDTVPFGFFKRNIFEKIGLFNESLVRAQDYEFNKRILHNKGKIWLNPNIVIKYYNQSSFIKFLKKQFFYEAPYNSYMWYVAPYTFSYRHAITGLFTIGLIGGLIVAPFNIYIKIVYYFVLSLYLLMSVIASFQQSFRFKLLRHLLLLPLSFFSFHIFHGLGVIIGLIKILFKTAPIQK